MTDLQFRGSGMYSGISRRRFLTWSGAGLSALALAPRRLLPTALADARCDNLRDNWSAAVQARLADRHHRMQHFSWHLVRNSWHNLSDAQRSDISKLGWKSDRPSMLKPKWDPTSAKYSGYWATHNGSGEDFLYFHRWMIAMTDEWLRAEGKRPLDAWSDMDKIPAPNAGCPDELVTNFVPIFEGEQPNPSLVTRVREVKADHFYWDRMVWWEHQFKDRAYLKGLNLGQFGSTLEYSVHNQMHLRWSAYPTSGPLLRPEWDLNPKWDTPGYDSLFDEYSSHVTPLFWRLHKWIDNRIRDWGEANGLQEQEVSVGPVKFKWYRPDGNLIQVREPWLGGPMDSIERVVGIISPKPREGALLKAGEEPENRGITLRNLDM